MARDTTFHQVSQIKARRFDVILQTNKATTRSENTVEKSGNDIPDVVGIRLVVSY